MQSLLSNLAVLPFLAATALPQPVQLTDNQMDRVTAGRTLLGIDIINISSFALTVALPLNLTFIAAIVAEDSVFRGVTTVTLER